MVPVTSEPTLLADFSMPRIKRSRQPLKPMLRSWYKELRDKLRKQGVECQPQGEKGPEYMDLAIILRKALETLPPEEH